MTERGHILVVEDDLDVQELLSAYLGAQGYRVSVVDNGGDMRDLMADDPADLVLMDLNLPGEDGFVLTRYLREKYRIGIIILTGRTETVDRIVGLEIGADDYVTKPFETRELLARIRSVLRRVGDETALAGQGLPREPRLIRFADWLFDHDNRRLTRNDGSEADLTGSEHALLTEFVEHQGEVLSRMQLMSAVYQREWEPTDRSIDVLVTRLRRKLEHDPANPEIIKTVRGRGYAFAPLAERVAPGGNA